MIAKYLISCLCLFLLTSLVSAKILFDSTLGTTFTPDKDWDYNIFMMNDDGSDIRKLTDTPFSETSPIWAPNGKAIAFARDLDIALTTVRQTDLFIKAINGTFELRLTDHPKQDGGNITWSPDGKFIAFVSTRSGKIDIFKIDVASLDVEQLTNNALLGGLSAAPDWSPNGKQITYQQAVPGVGRTIYTMDADGRNQKHLIPADGIYKYCPKWSPDGDTIIYGEVEYELINRKRIVVAERLVIHKVFTKETQLIIPIPIRYKISKMSWISPGHEIIFSAKDRETNIRGIFRYHIGDKKYTKLIDGLVGADVDWIDDVALDVMPNGKLSIQWGQLKRRDQ